MILSPEIRNVEHHSFPAFHMFPGPLEVRTFFDILDFMPKHPHEVLETHVRGRMPHVIYAPFGSPPFLLLLHQISVVV